MKIERESTPPPESPRPTAIQYPTVTSHQAGVGSLIDRCRPVDTQNHFVASQYPVATSSQVEVFTDRYRPSEGPGFSNSTKDPRFAHRFIHCDGHLPPMEDETPPFGRLSPAPTSKLEGSAGAISSGCSGQSMTDIDNSVVGTASEELSGSSPTVKMESGAPLCAVDLGSCSNPIGKRAMSLEYGIASQGDGFRRAKRMCAADFLDLDIDKDNLP
jgi:hypothetical protein